MLALILQIRLTKDRLNMRKKIAIYHVHCTYTQEHSVMRNSKGWLELGFI